MDLYIIKISSLFKGDKLMGYLYRRKAKAIKVEDQSQTHNIHVLEKMATNKELKAIFKKIKNENIPSVRNAWIDYFLESIKRSKFNKID